MLLRDGHLQQLQGDGSYFMKTMQMYQSSKQLTIQDIGANLIFMQNAVWVLLWEIQCLQEQSQCHKERE